MSLSCKTITQSHRSVPAGEETIDLSPLNFCFSPYWLGLSRLSVQLNGTVQYPNCLGCLMSLSFKTVTQRHRFVPAVKETILTWLLYQLAAVEVLFCIFNAFVFLFCGGSFLLGLLGVQSTRWDIKRCVRGLNQESGISAYIHEFLMIEYEVRRMLGREGNHI